MSTVSLDPKVVIVLDHEREIKWTMPCMAKLGRLQDPPEMVDLMSTSSARSYYALCAFIWACLVDPEEVFKRPEPDIAQYLDTKEKIASAGIALFQALRQAGLLKPEKKTDDSLPSSRVSSENNGRKPSLNSAPRARGSKT